MTTIFTVGHSNVPKEKLLERLKVFSINRLVDVRTKPYSRYCPQYNKLALSQYLEENGITYDFRGENLGGLGENVDYDENIRDLAALAETEKIAVMCSEKDYKQCHRYLMLTPDFEKQGLQVEHISYENVRERSTD
jgi:uncharacterized protein (DUF488 family)